MGKRRNRAAGSRLRGLGLAFLACALPWGLPHAQETVCAVVKIEIRQELTLERQAFEARMKITNGLDTLALEEVSINVLFQDEAGNSVPASSDPNNGDALFFIRVDTMDGIGGISGNGHIPPNGVAEITWLIIPTTGAGGTSPVGKLYGVGATLEYRFGGDAETVNVAPDVIRVKPTPVLTLDYFLPREVFGNDPMTPEDEDPEPFDLGVRITNSGAGDARALKIESAQPRIVENNQGLLVDFLLHGTSVDDQPVQNTLLADFGTLLAGRTKVARWVMTSSLTGTFISFQADYVHSDELGGQLTSLIHDIRTHELVWSVKNDMPGRDNVRDFLVRAGDGYRILESDGVDADVIDRSAAAALTQLPPIGGMARYQLSFPATQTPHFAAVADPNPDAVGAYSAWRSDGKRVDAANVWRFRRPGATSGYTRHIGLFDVGSSGSYELRFDGDAQQNSPPQIEEVPPLSVPAGTLVALDISASDPDGDAVTLSAGALPANASFVDLGQGQGRFEWVPTRAQIGIHAVRIFASDGHTSVYRDLSITVTPAAFVDTDGDGMDDDWEIEHFGDLSRDGTGDYDQDGATDLDEFLYGGNPTVEDRPGVPIVLFPLPGSTLEPAPFEFVVANAERAELAEVVYRFEVYRDEGLRDLVSMGEVAEGVGETRLSFDMEPTGGDAFTWRVRAHDGATPGNWAYGQFRFLGDGVLAQSCAVASPRDGEVVDSLRPRLGVRVGGAPDGAIVRYRIEAYRDAALADLAALSPILVRPADAELGWRVYPELEQGQSYHWRAVLIGIDSVEHLCPGGTFAVDTGNSAPHGYSLDRPGENGRVEHGSVVLLASGAEDADGDAISLYFELDAEPTFDSPGLLASGAVDAPAGAGQWQVDGLAAATRFFARVRAGDGLAFGPWRYVAFHSAALAADLTKPNVRNPHPGSWIETPTPRLEVAAVPHPAQDQLGYRFELFADETLADALATAMGGSTVDIAQPLQDRRWYWWRARAEDGDQSGAWSDVARFFVIDNGFDDVPQFKWLHPGEADTHARPGIETLRWQLFDPDSVARADLFYQRVGDEGEPIMIAVELAEDEAQTYPWDTSSLDDGDYRLHAVVRDASTTLTHHAQGLIRIATPGLLVEGDDRVTGEDARSVSLTVRLQAMPEDLIIVPISVTRPDEARTEPDMLVFTPANWDQLQTLNVIGQDDDVQDGDQHYAVTLGAVDSDDAGYDGLYVVVDGFINEDDDTAGFVIDAELPLVTSEDGGAADFSVHLATEPTAPVRLYWQVSDPTEGSVNPESLLFDAGNWSQPQLVQVAGVDDDVLDGDIEYAVFVSAIESDDTVYADLEGPVLPAINLDNDAVMILVTPTEGVEVDESGASATLMVTVNGAPNSQVSISVTTSDPSAGAVVPSEVTIEPGDWDVPRSVSVIGVDDGLPSGDRVFHVRFGNSVSDDPRFDGLSVPDVSVINRDVRIGGLQVGESGPETWAPGDLHEIPLAAVFDVAPLIFPVWESEDSQPFALRLVSVSTESFVVALVRPQGADSPPSIGRLVFLAIEPGVHRLPDGRELVAGSIETLATLQQAGGSWQEIVFPVPFRQSPVVLTQIQSMANETAGTQPYSEPWLTVAVDQAGPVGVSVALERSETTAGEVLHAERIGYLAIAANAQGIVELGGESVAYEAAYKVDGAVGIEQGCLTQLLEDTRAQPPILIAGMMSRREADGGWLRVCSVARSAASFAVDEDTAHDPERQHGEEAIGWLLFDRPFHAELSGAPIGVQTSPNFGLRTYPDALGTGFSLQLSDRPLEPITLSLSALQDDGVIVVPQQIIVAPEAWGELQWVRVEALTGSGFPAPRTARVRVEVESEGDPRFAGLEPVEVSLEVGAPGGWTRIVDNLDLAFLAHGEWEPGDAPAGFYGTDFLVHPAIVPGLQDVVIDNTDPGFSRIGAWQVSTEFPGFYGDDYEVRASGQSNAALIVDDLDADRTGLWIPLWFGSEHYGPGYSIALPWIPKSQMVWAFPGIEDSDYEVFARWVSGPVHASNAPYEVRHVDGSNVVRVNQRVQGGQWVSLGTYRLDGSSSVALNNSVLTGLVVADAVMIVPTGSSPASATWSMPVANDGTYEVHAHWPAHESHATDAPFLVHHADGETLVRVDQSVDGGSWRLLGSYRFEAGDLARVVLTDEVEEGSVVADAVRFRAPGTSPGDATWLFADAPLGKHLISGWWPEDAEHSASAPFQVVSVRGSTSLTANQRDDGARWVPFVDAVMGAGLDVMVQLTATSEGAVAADAVRAIDVVAFGPPGSLLLDDAYAEYVGDWTRIADAPDAYDAAHMVAMPGDGTAHAQWNLSVEEVDQYRLYVRWPANGEHAEDAPYEVDHANGSDTVFVDQRIGGGQWHLLGTYGFGPDSRIRLRDTSSGRVAADAIRIEPARYPVGSH